MRFLGLGEVLLLKEAQEDLLERQRDVVVAFAGSIKACKGIMSDANPLPKTESLQKMPQELTLKSLRTLEPCDVGNFPSRKSTSQVGNKTLEPRLEPRDVFSLARNFPPKNRSLKI